MTHADLSAEARVLVPATVRHDRLHMVIQEAMGWTNSHLHMFTKGEDSYGAPDPDMPLRHEKRHTLRDLAAVEGASFDYEYDFGDGWDHQIVLERILPSEPARRYPTCVAGARACPPEDCGGPWGYAELTRGGAKASGFDPERFDVDEANRRLDLTVRG
jgi:hypothetical protein